MYNLAQKMQSILNINTSEKTLPSYYEYVVENNNITIPCTTWYILTDIDNKVGDTMQYSEVTVRVSVWATGLQELYTNSDYIDDIMKTNGFRRISYQDIHCDDQLIKRVCSYKGTAREEI